VRRWELGDCEFSHQYLYGWEDETLLKALFSVPNCFSEEYRWEFDTTSTPWLIHLRKASTKPMGEIRYQKNMVGIEKVSDPTGIITRLYPYGYGEGENKLNIKNLNGGIEYLEAPTVSKYGIIEGYWKDARYQIEESLYQAAKKRLDMLSVPYVSYDVDIVHIGNLKDRTVGDLVRVIDDEDGTDFYTRIVSVDKSDVGNKPDDATFKIANKPADIASYLTDVEDRQRVSETYSQGAVTLFTQQFYDNCSPESPAEFRFYVPNNVVHINQIMLDGNAAAFRAYSKSAKAGGKSSQTSEAGGGDTKTTSTDGEKTRTSGPSSKNTTESGTVYVNGAVSGVRAVYSDAYANTGVAEGHSHSMRNHAHTFSGTSDTHSHGMGHTHIVTIPAHDHTVTFPAHNHKVDIPDHTHTIEYGIYTGTTASELTVEVDGNIAGSFSGRIDELNLIAFLSTDENGKVNRGRHTIKIIPDKLTRVEMDLVYQLYANSRGGSQY
ncbi:MAG TPA: phage tail spike protein, partial [Clostridia bacterium]|nr:phage tail spike protein [Clostridia bacterium]